MLTATRGEATISHRFLEYSPVKGDIPGRQNGVLISMGSGMAIPYAIFNLQDRGKFFIEANVDVYGGQVVGENSRSGDLVINLQKGKQLTNMRASGSDDAVLITPPIRFSLEESLEYIEKDELVEVTPKSIRMRKIYLDEQERKKFSRTL
jgi:GTP-binding protein